MFNRSLEIARRNQDAHGEVIDLLNLGRLYTDMGYRDESLKFLMSHAQVLTELGQTLGLDMSPQGIAATYMAIGNYCRGLNADSGMRKIRRQFTDVFVEDICLNTFSLRGPQGNSVLYQRLGNLNQALATYKWTIDLQKKLGDLAVQSMTLNNIGLVHKTRGDFPKAVECFEQSVEISSRIGARYGQAITVSNMASIYAKWGEAQKAKDLLEQSLIFKNEIGAKASEAYNYMDLGDLMGNLGLHQEALDYREKAMKLTEELRTGLLPSERRNFYDVKIGGFYRSEPAKGLTRVRMKLNEPMRTFEPSETIKA